MIEKTRGILDCILPRLIQPTTTSIAVLGLEVLDGPYKGVVFGFTKFDVMPERLANGMVPTRFETTLYHSPEGFVKDESFDAFTSEVLVAWLSYIALTDINGLIKAPTTGVH